MPIDVFHGYTCAVDYIITDSRNCTYAARVERTFRDPTSSPNAQAGGCLNKYCKQEYCMIESLGHNVLYNSMRLRPFYGTCTQNKDVMTSKMCFKYNQPTKPIRLIFDGSAFNSLSGLTTAVIR